ALPGRFDTRRARRSAIAARRRLRPAAPPPDQRRVPARAAVQALPGAAAAQAPPALRLRGGCRAGVAARAPTRGLDPGSTRAAPEPAQDRVRARVRLRRLVAPSR